MSKAEWLIEILKGKEGYSTEFVGIEFRTKVMVKFNGNGFERCLYDSWTETDLKNHTGEFIIIAKDL